MVWALWAKASGNQRSIDEIERLSQIVRGQELALKLKREQDKLHDQETHEQDLQTVAKIRAAADTARAIGFVRDPLRPAGPGPGEPVPGAGAPSVAKPDKP